jgi:hypothetical protein
MNPKTMSDSDDYLQVIWYDAKTDSIFQSGMLEGLFCALEIRQEWWSENPHIDIVGLL